MYRNLLSLALIYFISYVTSTDRNYRLDTPIVPSAYHITITPYFDTGDTKQFTFDGTVIIQFTTTAITNQIKLHSEDLSYSFVNVSVTTNTGSSIALYEATPLEFDTNYTFAYINLNSNLEPGIDYVLQITYTGPIRADLYGFYRSYYWQDGVKKWFGVTQMGLTHARKVFPCFDEPELKATFTLTIDRPNHYQPSLSNTWIAQTYNLTNGYTRETFYPTPRMSTYLVAFSVSEFEAGDSTLNDTQKFGVYTRPEAKNQTEFAFNFGIKVKDALGTYFGIDYYSMNEYLTLDHVALPDFSYSAMENWGLIKYREALLLYVPEHSTPFFKYRVAQIVAHETTHMWFGNLVTCHWWSNAWLNEGFANYFQDYITSLVDPSLGSDNMLVIGSVYSAYDADNSPTSVPITNDNVNSPAEVSGHFGTITYQKAGSVIRMMHHLIQNDAFKYGLNFYLKNNSFSTGDPDKLYQGLNEGVAAYNTLSAYPGATIADIMSSWITQAGHPVLQVNIDYSTDTVTLNQKRFYINASHSSNEIYKIPITYTTQLSPDFSNTKPVFILENKTHEFKIANISQGHSWVIFNVQETGFYRVNYDDHAWQIIASALKENDMSGIHHLNRAKIVNDLFALLYADEVSFSTLYNVLEFLQRESHYTVWFAAIKGFNKIYQNYLGDNEVFPFIQEYILRFLDYGITKLGYEERNTDNFEDLRNRMQILELACKLGHSGCLDKTVELFKMFRQNGTEVTPSLRPVVYCTGLHRGNREDYEFLWNRMLSSNVANEIWVIQDALGCTANEEMLKRYLVSMAGEDSPIRAHDLTRPLASVLRNYDNLHVVMDELKYNYTLWASVYPSMSSVLSTVASVLRTDSDFTEFETWLASCIECTEDSKAAARRSLESAKATRSWADTHKADILKSLKSGSDIAMPSIVIMVLGLYTILLNYCI